ncbi:unnamed protein product [Coffea canephora]|uniref:DH200=94 genomic scaffold, scaffold_150 n=1 Tax=Coffea canephora TaxID=49390 RepID=A0A068V9F9_COFCA|nr:unnamed protein product [Coffea canephora]
MSDVPQDILEEMLSRLPVKPLLRFRCVSKQWKAIIDSPEFIRLHIAQSLETRSHHSVILRHSYLHSADFESLNRTNRAIFEELNHPLKTPDYKTEILGSCNGLLCLMNTEEDIILWNPSTRRYQKLPLTETELPGEGIYGFGYDCVSDDYQVVKIVQFYGVSSDTFDSEVKIYSLRSNSWKRIQDFPYYLRYRRVYGMLANGVLHWLVTRNPKSYTAVLIAAFDLATEEYRLVPQPIESDKNFHMNVEVLGGCLCVLCNYYLDHVDIWVMKDYGVKESWTKLISIRQCDVSSAHFEVVRPIAYSKCGKRVLLEQDCKLLAWYDLEKKTTKRAMTRFSFDPWNLSFVLDMCFESLVQLGSHFDFGKVDKKGQNPNREPKRSQAKAKQRARKRAT